MNQKRVAQRGQEYKLLTESYSGKTYYDILNLHPSTSTLEIRRSYRELSKRYHPDTTALPLAIAKTKFQELNEAYGVLSSPEKRSTYDLHIGYSRINVIQAPSTSQTVYSGPCDRPLSSGEIFALFLLALTFIGCLLLAVGVAMIRGEEAWQLPALILELATSK